MESKSLIFFVFYDPNTNDALGFRYLEVLSTKPFVAFINAFVKKEYRGRGLASAFLKFIERKLHDKLKGGKLLASVHKDNTPSLKSVAKMGFVRVSKEREKILRTMGKLPPDHYRFEKKY